MPNINLLGGSTLIPFIRVLPNGRKVMHPVERSVATGVLARQFLRNRGRYMITINDDLTVHLVAVLLPTLKGEEPDLCAEATCYNDPGLLQAVDLLVRDSVTIMEQKRNSKVIH